MKALLFDFDGTLVDSMPAWSSKVLNILELTHTPYPDGIITTLATLGDIGTVKYFREKLGVTLSEEEMFSLMDSYALPKYRDEIPLKDGVKDFLLYAKDKGYSLNVLTASPHKMLDPCLKRTEIYGLFDNIWSCEDFGTTKSDPNIYVKSAEQIGFALKDIAFFDDNIGAIKTAQKAGMFTVGVFDKTGEAFLNEMKATANIFVNGFNELKSNGF